MSIFDQPDPAALSLARKIRLELRPLHLGDPTLLPAWPGQEGSLDSGRSETLAESPFLYDPFAQDDDLQFVKSLRTQGLNQGTTLSCPGCFTQVTYSSDRRTGTFTANRAFNVTVDSTKTIVLRSKGGLRQRSRQAQLQASKQVFFQMKCQQCDTVLGGYQADSRVYYFTEVLS